MLFFLFYAAKAGFVMDRYEDEAVGETGKNASGAVAMLKVRLRPTHQLGRQSRLRDQLDGAAPSRA